MQNAYNIKRNKKGEVISFSYKGGIWTKSYLWQILGRHEIAQRRALIVILENEEKRPKTLFNWNYSYQNGFHSKNGKLADLAPLLIKCKKWSKEEKEICSKFLPLYADQIWAKILANLKLKPISKNTFSSKFRF